MISVEEVLFGSPLLMWACIGAIVCILIGKEHLTTFWCVIGFIPQLISILGNYERARYDRLPNQIAAFVTYAVILTLLYLWRVRYRKSLEAYNQSRSHDAKEEAPVDPSLLVSDKEFAQAQRLIEFGVRHPAVKEIAQLKGITPRQVILDSEETVRSWNLQNREKTMS